MKKLLFIIGMLIISVSVFSQTRMLKGFYAGTGDSIAFIKAITEADGLVKLYGATNNRLYIADAVFDTTSMDLRITSLEEISDLDSIRQDGANVSFYYGGVELLAVDTTNLSTQIVSLQDTTAQFRSELDNTVDASTITARMDAIYVQDSMTNKDGKIAHYIESTQYYPAIEEQTNAIRAIQDAGGTLQAICTWCDLIPLNTLAIVNQRILFSNIYIPESATDLTGIYWVQTVTGAYTADNNNKVGLYSVDGDSIRLIASSANDGDLWKAADSTFQYKAFSSAYSDPEPGVYYTAFIYCISGSTTAPQLGARYNAISGLNARALIGNNHFSSGYLDNQTDFPTAIALADISQLTGIYWSGVY